LDFPGWLNAGFGVVLPSREFLLLNVFGLFLMSIGLTIAFANPRRYAWLFVGLASTLMLNALTHAGASIITASYSPGTGSAVLFWIPMGPVVYRCCAPALRVLQLAASVVGGFAVNMIVWIAPVLMEGRT
jgi:hypothetical protein